MIKFTDRVSVGSTKQTQEGYLIATARVARTGVQEYYARELGDIATKSGFKPDQIVRVYRHADQVFSKDSLSTITRLPITIDHPADDVTAANWRDLSVGELGDAYTTEGDWVIVNPMLKDAKGVKAATTTHQQLSMGYSAGIIKARDGLNADFEVVDIKYNHLALVPAARAGDKARIGDSWGASPITDFQPGIAPKHEGGRMPDLKTVVLGDRAVQVADSDVLAIENFKADMAKKLADADAAKKKTEDEKDEEIGELKALLKKAKDAASIDIDALVASRAALVAEVKAIDAKIDPKGLSDANLKKAAVAAKMGDSFVTGASDPEIAGMYKILAKDAAASPGNPATKVFQGGVVSVGDAANQAAAALQKSSQDMNAWRNQ